MGTTYRDNDPEIAFVFLLLFGWWDVNDGIQYYYYFGADGHVQYTKGRPISMFTPPKVPKNSGTYNLRPNNVVFIRWNPVDGGATEETFTADGTRRAMWNVEPLRGLGSEASLLPAADAWARGASDTSCRRC